MSGPGNSQQPPAGAPSLTQEQAQLLAQAMVPQLKAFAPHLTDEQALGLAFNAVAETTHLEQVVTDALDQARRLENPGWGFVVKAPPGAPGGLTEGVIVVAKRFADCRDLNESLHFITIIATLTSPLARSLLRAFGYDYHYVQSRNLPEKQKLIV